MRIDHEEQGIAEHDLDRGEGLLAIARHASQDLAPLRCRLVGGQVEVVAKLPHVHTLTVEPPHHRERVTATAYQTSVSRLVGLPCAGRLGGAMAGSTAEWERYGRWGSAMVDVSTRVEARQLLCTRPRGRRSRSIRDHAEPEAPDPQGALIEAVKGTLVFKDGPATLFVVT